MSTRFSLQYLILLFPLVAVLPDPALADFNLVEAGKPRAVIVTADEPSEAAKGAAQDFQNTVKQMTGAALPVVPESAYDGKTPPVLIGPSKLVKQRGVDVAQDYEKADHYVVRVTDEFVALVGNDA